MKIKLNIFSPLTSVVGARNAAAILASPAHMIMQSHPLANYFWQI